MLHFVLQQCLIRSVITVVYLTLELMDNGSIIRWIVNIEFVVFVITNEYYFFHNNLIIELA